MQDVSGIRCTMDELMATLDEINSVAFVLLRVLVVTTPKKKSGYGACMYSCRQCVSNSEEILNQEELS